MHIWYGYLILAYLIGSVSSAIIISKLFKLNDPREYGSKNPGATNMLRGGNKKAAALTLLGDSLKGLLAVLIVRFVHINYEPSGIIAWCGILVVLGHIYPIFFRFKGGKGVATAAGVMFGFNLYLGLALLASWLVVFKFSKISSLSAILAIILAPIYAFLLFGNDVYFGAVLVIAIFVLYKHKANILRLITKKEATIL